MFYTHLYPDQWLERDQPVSSQNALVQSISYTIIDLIVLSYQCDEKLILLAKLDHFNFQDEIQQNDKVWLGILITQKTTLIWLLYEN